MNAVKRIVAFSMFGFFITMCIFFATFEAHAEDVAMSVHVSDVQSGTAKNGSPYIRVLVKEKRTLNGVAYEATIPIMFFGALAEQGKAIKAGDQLKLIASKKEYQGAPSYNALAIVK